MAVQQIPPLTQYKYRWIVFPILGGLAGYMLGGMDWGAIGYALGSIPTAYAWLTQYREATRELNSLEMAREGLGKSTLGQLARKALEFAEEVGSFDVEQHALNIIALVANYARRIRAEARTRAAVLITSYIISAIAMAHLAHLVSDADTPIFKLGIEKGAVKTVIMAMGMAVGIVAGALWDSLLIGLVLANVGLIALFL